jgi:pyridoxal phosphate enzyme (YggS family)
VSSISELTIADRLSRVQSTIAAAASRSGRRLDSITLVAVSKTVDATQVLEAVRLGVTHLGENRVQEAEDKIAEVSRGVSTESLSLPTWHLIGHLQTNKARPAARLFSLIESVDSSRLAVALDRLGREVGRTIDILLEVNSAGEDTKFGLAPNDVLATYAEIAQLPAIRIRGLMTVAPAVEDPEKVRPYFRMLRQLREKLLDSFPDAELPHLSMGMTGDYPIAIEEGATIVRVGRAIFGERTVPP